MEERNDKTKSTKKLELLIPEIRDISSEELIVSFRELNKEVMFKRKSSRGKKYRTQFVHVTELLYAR
jgi:hypothetical protein